MEKCHAKCIHCSSSIHKGHRFLNYLFSSLMIPMKPGTWWDLESLQGYVASWKGVFQIQSNSVNVIIFQTPLQLSGNWGNLVAAPQRCKNPYFQPSECVKCVISDFVKFTSTSLLCPPWFLGELGVRFSVIEALSSDQEKVKRRKKKKERNHMSKRCCK